MVPLSLLPATLINFPFTCHMICVGMLYLQQTISYLGTCVLSGLLSFPTSSNDVFPMCSPTQSLLISSAHTSPLCLSLLLLTYFPLLSLPPCPHPLVQSLHCQFVALASPSVIDHGGNSVVFAGLEMCGSAGKERRSNTLITADLQVVPATGSSHVTRTGRRETPGKTRQHESKYLLNPDALTLALAHIH